MASSRSCPASVDAMSRGALVHFTRVSMRDEAFEDFEPIENEIREKLLPRMAHSNSLIISCGYMNHVFVPELDKALILLMSPDSNDPLRRRHEMLGQDWLASKSTFAFVYIYVGILIPKRSWNHC